MPSRDCQALGLINTTWVKEYEMGVTVGTGVVLMVGMAEGDCVGRWLVGAAVARALGGAVKVVTVGREVDNAVGAL